MIKSINIEEFFKVYEETAISLSDAKKKVTDEFIDKEERLKDYELALGDLDHAKNEANLDMFQKEIDMFIATLSNFDVSNIENNIEMVLGAIKYLSDKKNEVSKVAKKVTSLKNFWKTQGLEKNSFNDDSRVKKDIQEELIFIENQMSSTTFDEVQRVEDQIESARKKIEQIVSATLIIKRYIDKYTFVGIDAVDLQKDMKNFLERDLNVLETKDLVDKSRKLVSRVDEIKKGNETETRKMPIYKTKKEPHSYFMEPRKGFLINFSMSSAVPDGDLERLDGLIYIDNYPVKGVFENDYFYKNMCVSDKMFDLVNTFYQKSVSRFLLSAGVMVILSVLGMMDIMPLLYLIPSEALVALGYVYNFKTMKDKISKKMGIPGALMVSEVDLILLKEGEEGFPFQYILPALLKDFDKLLVTK